MRYRDHGPGLQTPDVERALFRPTTRGRVACTVCGISGYYGAPWQRPHRRGHAPCLNCGRQLTVRLDGTPRKHNRCPRKESNDGND